MVPWSTPKGRCTLAITCMARGCSFGAISGLDGQTTLEQHKKQQHRLTEWRPASCWLCALSGSADFFLVSCPAPWCRDMRTPHVGEVSTSRACWQPVVLLGFLLLGSIPSRAASRSFLLCPLFALDLGQPVQHALRRSLPARVLLTHQVCPQLHRRPGHHACQLAGPGSATAAAQPNPLYPRSTAVAAAAAAASIMS